MNVRNVRVRISSETDQAGRIVSRTLTATDGEGATVVLSLPQLPSLTEGPWWPKPHRPLLSLPGTRNVA